MTPLERIHSKIIEPEQLNRLLAIWRFKNHQVVFTNGCFDIIHLGHIQYLAAAALLGDKLLIGLNSDSSVRRLKGETRPINPELARAQILASFNFVDAVVLFSEDTPYELIKKVRPSILVKGGDYKPEDIVGYDIVTSNGGRIETIPFVEGFSSTSIIKKGGLT